MQSQTSLNEIPLETHNINEKLPQYLSEFKNPENPEEQPNKPKKSLFIPEEDSIKNSNSNNEDDDYLEDSEDQAESNRKLKSPREDPSPYRIIRSNTLKHHGPILPNSAVMSQKKKGDRSVKPQLKSNLISMLGRIMIIIRQAKKRISFYKMQETSTKNLLLINDLSHFIEEKVYRRHSSIYLKRKQSRVEILREYIISEALQEAVRMIAEGMIKLSQKLIISPSNKFLIFWNLLLSAAIAFTSFSITIDLFFQENWNHLSRHHQILDAFLSFSKHVLVADIIIRLNTGFFQAGNIILSRKEIFLNYIKTEFARDVLGVCSIYIEIESINNTSSQHVCSVLSSYWNFYKIIFGLKLLTMKSIFDNFSEMIIHNDKLEGLLSLLKLFFHIVFTAHIIACIWNFGWQYEIYVNGGNVTWQGKLLKDADWDNYYIYSIYWSLTTMITVGYGDIIPTNYTEVIITILAMIYGCGFFAYSINSIGTIIQKFDENEKNFREDLRLINKYMLRKHINYGLQVKVRRYLENYWKESVEAEKEEDVLNKLSTSLRREVLVESNAKLLYQSPLLVSTFSQETLERICQVLKPVDLAPQEILFQEGSQNEGKLFFIVKGELEALNHFGSNRKVIRVKSFKAGSCFGHLEFFNKALNYSFTASSKEFSSICCLERDDLIEIIKGNSEDWEKFHLLKDEICLYNNISKLDIRCFACEQTSHLTPNCPFISYAPNRDLIMKKHIYSALQKREEFTRTKQKNVSPLLIKKILADNANYIASMNVLPNSDETEHTITSSISIGRKRAPVYSGEGFSVEKISNDGGVEAGDSSPKRRKSRIEPDRFKLEPDRFRDGGVSPRAKTIVEEEDKMERINLFEGRKMTASLMVGSVKINDFLPQNNINENISFEQRRQPIQNNIFPTAPNVFQQEEASLFINLFDCKKDFDIYFPYNNPEIVVSYFKEKLKKSLRKRKKSRNNSLANEKKNMNITLNGIIGFNNQRKFFRKSVKSKFNKFAAAEKSPEDNLKSMRFDSSYAYQTEGLSPSRKKGQSSMMLRNSQISPSKRRSQLSPNKRNI